jgi:GT2 family glycosyltransferase
LNVTAVTPWHNHRDLGRDYWNALRKEGCEVIVVDNGSDPPLPNGWRLEHNSGFSHASNVGLKLARTDAVLFLNNDVYVSETGWLAKLTAALEPGVLVGSVLRYEQHTIHGPVQLPYIDGWCLLGMREDLLELGGFDETYEEPSYYSDNDLCLRARAAGMTLREAPCGIHHKGGQTSQANGYSLPATVANRARFEALVEDMLGVAA